MEMMSPSHLNPTLHIQTGAQIERSTEADIREERDDLKEAAEQTLNFILDLSLDGVIRWVSPSWTDVIGTTIESALGQSIRNFVVSENREVFSEATEAMKKDNTRSQFIHFALPIGPSSKLANLQLPIRLTDEFSEGLAQKPNSVIELEGQGILVSARNSDRDNQLKDSTGETHVSYPVTETGFLSNFESSLCG